MRFDFRVSGDPYADMQKEVGAAEHAVTTAMRAASNGLKADWRAQIRSAGLGNRLANTVRSLVFPGGAQKSIGAAGIVYSKAPVIVDAQERGVLIRSARGFWLAIPVAEVARMRAPRGYSSQRDQFDRINLRITPGGWERRTGKRLQFIYRKGKPSLLVDTGEKLSRTGTYDPMSWGRKRNSRAARSWKIIFILVPQAKLRPKLRLTRAADQWGDRLPGLILSNWRGI